MNAAARLLNQGVLSRSWVISAFIKKSQFLPFFMVLSVLVSALGVVYVSNTTYSLNAGVQQAESERDRLHMQWNQLLVEKSAWTMQAHLQNTAENRLGMMVPDHKSVVVINE